MKRILGLIVINLLVIFVLGSITPYFMTKSNFIVMIDNLSLEAIVLSGYTLLLAGGYFDLSIDGIVALTGVSAGLLMTAGISWPVAILLALALALFIGFVNGIIVSKLGVNGLIATLTTWWICIGFSLGLTKALAPYGFPEPFQALAQTRVLGFRITVFYALAFLVVSTVLLDRTRFGSHIYVMGDNPLTAKLMGIPVERLGIYLYILIGGLAGFVGLMTASRLDAASPIAVDGMALRVIAAAVIGGGNLSGGKGSVLGGFLGLLLMTFLSNSIIHLGVSPYWQKAVLGSTLLVAVLSERIKRS